ncbi:MAG: type II/IV secretion system protein [Pirellulales bacterium]|nr:type II/IV secretion system protein [Pirellulales bacterium]
MRESISDRLDAELAKLDPADPHFATDAVDCMLAAGRAAGASDLHLQPGADGLQLKARTDGVLRQIAVFPAEVAGNIVSRLKVRAELLTYHTDRPQEGRIRTPDGQTEIRVSTFPTLHGEKAVVRLFGVSGRYERLDDLGLHDEVFARLRQLLAETSGAVLVSGPAGSGKTTTAYACLRELARETEEARSLVSIEDPIEVAVAGVAQSQVNPAVGLDLATGLRFLMRQDPEVILVGEIRDRPTAEAAMRASLTGHLLLSTFHAGSAAETVSRLLDMGIEPYVLRSGLLGILCQRLVRRLCRCATLSEEPDAALGLPVERVMVPVGCDACGGTGYQGRLLLAEMLTPKRTELGRAILSRSDTATLEHLAVGAGMITRWQRACWAVESGLTSPAEVRRVLGFSDTTDGISGDPARQSVLRRPTGTPSKDRHG